MSHVVDLSCDLGEAVSIREQKNELAIWPLITAANVACGGHVGDEATMSAAAELCRLHGVILGAHPSYPDRESFGRRSMLIESAELKRSLLDQLRALRTAAGKEKLEIERVKPHGALYNDAFDDRPIATAILDAVEEFDRSAAVVCQDGSVLSRLAGERGVPLILEAFADRRYEADGRLVARSDPSALLLDFDEAADQAWSLLSRSEVRAKNGVQVVVRFQTLCIHSDMEGSPDRLKRIRQRLDL